MCKYKFGRQGVDLILPNSPNFVACSPQGEEAIPIFAKRDRVPVALFNYSSFNFVVDLYPHNNSNGNR